MPRFGLGLITLACALTAAACAGTKPNASITGSGGGPSGAAGSGAASGGRGGGSVTGAGGIIVTGGTNGGGGACVPSTVCEPPGGRYCGTIGAGCPGQKLECPACPGDSICESNQCVGGASCTPITCGNYCGTIGDGCGRKLDCTAAARRPAMPQRHLRRSGLRAADLQRRRQRPLLRHDRRRLRRHARLRRVPERRRPAAAPAASPTSAAIPTA